MHQDLGIGMCAKFVAARDEFPALRDRVLETGGFE